MSTGEAQDWLENAQADLRYARVGRNEPGIALNLVAFHAQQAVEKALKALLVARRSAFPRTHDLEELSHILRDTGRQLPVEFERIGDLTPFAVQTRYPGFDDPAAESEVDQAIELADRFIAWVVEQMNPH